MLNIGEKIKQARKTKRFTQDELARAIGVSDKSVSAYESSRINPPLPVLEKIAESTNHSMSYFLEDTLEADIMAKLKEIEVQFSEIKELLKRRK